MSPSERSPDTLILHDKLGWGGRTLWLAGGLFCCILPMWEFGATVWPLRWQSAVIGALIALGWVLGVFQMWVSLAGDARVIEIGPDRAVRITRKSLLSKGQDLITAADVEGTEIQTLDTDGRPDWFTVVLVLHSGGRVPLVGRNTAADAESLAMDIRRRIGV